jgi:hypothetical protein
MDWTQVFFASADACKFLEYLLDSQLLVNFYGMLKVRNTKMKSAVKRS